MMKSSSVLVSTAFVAIHTLANQALAQEKVYRCPGNEYTNNELDAKARNCKVIEGASVTVVSMPKPPAAATSNSSGSPRSGTAPAATPKTDSAEQRARDSDARLILEAELRTTEDKLANLKREFNNGEPEKRGEEFRNNQRYLDRIADLKSAISRSETDVSSLKRELARAAPAANAGSTAGTALAPAGIR